MEQGQESGSIQELGSTWMYEKEQEPLELGAGEVPGELLGARELLGE
jgi:hypothetical protein